VTSLLAALLLFAQVVFVPPVKVGVAAEGTTRSAKTPIPFPGEKEKWVRLVTPRFDIVSAATERRTRAVARDLETLAAALRELQPESRVAAPRVRVVIFPNRKDVQPYFDVLTQHESSNLSGLFVGRRDRGAMLIDGSRGISERTPYHELVHSLLAARGTRPPLWIEEGLAEFYSNADIRTGQITLGYPIREHLLLLRRHPVIPPRDLFAIRFESEGALQPFFYAESWAMVDALIRMNRRAFPDFVADVANGGDIEHALQVRYHLALKDLANSVAMYGNASIDRPSSTFSIAVASVPDVAPPVALSRAEVLYQLGTLLALVPGLEPDAERHFREALTLDPKYGRAMAAIGSLRVAAKKYADADQWYAKAADATPEDADVLLERAESLLRDELGPFAETSEITQDDIARFHRAREAAQNALARGADAGRAYGVIGTSYMRDADVAPGIAALEKAHALIPSRADYALHLFAMLRQSGQTEKADALFAVLESMHDVQVSYAARAVILRLELDRANALIRQQKLPEAAAVLRGLVSQTDDGRAKSDLARQADDIDQLARVNAQISAYNEAAHLVNDRHLKEAKAKLDALLATATDPKVIADATRLRDNLAARLK
jgi:tetratricopeptide (TPR) repeat protein